MLTLQKLKDMKPGEVFATGIVENSPDGIYMTTNREGDNLLWAAKRGNGYHDWTIYIHWRESKLVFVLTNGDKVTNKENIQKLVPCDEEALRMYRY